MDNVKMPRVSIVPGVTEGTVNVVLTKPNQINAGNPSAFPLAEDKFKGLNYQTASQSELKNDLSAYYEIMGKIMAGTNSTGDIGTLQTLTTKIREYVLTDDDYNLVVGSLQNMQTYILRFMYQDITNKAAAMDTELNKVVADINRFMLELETIYSKSPSSYPIPDNSVLRPKLAQDVKDTLAYTDSTNGVVISSTKPANPSGRGFIWFNTGAKV